MGPVVHDNPFLVAADPAGMPVPLEDALSMPSEALQGVPALVVARQAQAGLLNGAAAVARRFEQPERPGSHTKDYTLKEKKR
jgi:hypothetical protein